MTFAMSFERDVMSRPATPTTVTVALPVRASTVTASDGMCFTFRLRANFESASRIGWSKLRPASVSAMFLFSTSILILDEPKLKDLKMRPAKALATGFTASLIR